MLHHKAGRAMAVLGLLLLSTLFVTLPGSAQSIDPGTMQAEDPKNLTYEQNMMYLYGDDAADSHNNWELWTHSAPNDGESVPTIGEGNVIGDPNNGGGSRTFTWPINTERQSPRDEPMPIDPMVPITGGITLEIICNWEQGSCTKQVTIVLRLGNRDIAQTSIDTPDENDLYAFQFDHPLEEIPAGETFGLRLTFQKPGGPGDGYNLDLGRDNSWIEIPVLPPYTETVPGLDITDGYVSPYAKAAGFDEVVANSASWFGLIFWCLFAVGIFVAGFSLLPPIPFKEIAILLTGMGLLGSMFVVPLISGPVLTGMAADPDDPDIWTIRELAQQEEREGTFLGDTLVEGYKFTLYIEFDQIYTTKSEGELYSGIGFEGDEDILGDSETSRRGREYVQLYFSLFAMNLEPGQAVLADLMIMNGTHPLTGEEGVLLPMHVDAASGSPPVHLEVVVDGANSIRWVIPAKVCTLIGQDFSWQYYPILVTAVGLLLGGIGFYQVYNQGRPDLGEDEYDEDFEEVLDDFEDDFDEDFEDDLDDLEEL
jgi:hypothetical protein